jgi:hypothetical protein
MSVIRLLVTANVVGSSAILITLVMEAILSSETSVLTRTTRRNIPEDSIIHSHRRENLKCYIKSTVLLVHAVTYVAANGRTANLSAHFRIKGMVSMWLTKHVMKTYGGADA